MAQQALLKPGGTRGELFRVSVTALVDKLGRGPAPPLFMLIFVNAGCSLLNSYCQNKLFPF